jgi:hypothetical protein
MQVALIIAVSLLILENLVLALILTTRKVKRRKTTDLGKKMRTEYNSAMVNLRRLENLIREATGKDRV